jgi:hypothetical protein
MSRGPITVAFTLGESRRQVLLDDVQRRRVLVTSAARPVIGTDSVKLPPDSAAIIGPEALDW